MTAIISRPEPKCDHAQPQGRLTTIELEGANRQVTKALPSVCVCCGLPAEHVKEQRFGWFPKWIYLLAPVGGLPFAIAMLSTAKQMTVRLPVCPRHRNPLLAVRTWAALVLFSLLVVPWGVMALAAELERTGALLAFGGWLMLLVGVMTMMFVTSRRSLRPKRITNTSIVLAGVSPEFARRVK